MDRGLAGETLDSLEATAPWWWVAALGFFLVGDTVTTVVGVGTGRGVEASPVVASVLRTHGLVAMLGLKALTFGLAGLGWWRLPSPQRLGLPVGMTIVGVVATGWNVAVLVVPP